MVSCLVLLLCLIAYETSEETWEDIIPYATMERTPERLLSLAYHSCGPCREYSHV